MADTLSTNRLLAVLLGGLLAFGCSSGSVDGEDDGAAEDDGGNDGADDGGGNGGNGAPVITITSPERGTVSTADSVEVSGRVTGSGSISQVTINGNAAELASDGSFTANLALEEGITLIETVARDDAGRESTDARGVLAGNLVDQSTPVTEGLVANMSGTAMTGLSGMIQDFANNTDFTALATSLNPVVNTGDGCNSAKVFVESVQHEGVDVGAGPVAGGIAADVSVRNLTVTGRVTFRAVCVSGSADFTLTADGFNLTGTITPTLTGGDINVGLNGVANSFSGFAIDVSGIPGFVESLFTGAVRDQLSNILRDTITNMVPTVANGFLSDFLADSYSISILGQTISLSVTPSAMNWTEQGGTIVLDTSSTVDAAEGALYLSSPRPRPGDADLASTGIRIAVADDVLNQLLGSIWASGALEDTVLPLPGDALSAAFGGDVQSAAVTMILPPVANFDTSTGTAKLTIADLQMDASSPSGEVLASFVLSAEIDLAVETSADGRVRIVTRAPRILAQVLSQSDSLLTELTADKVAAIAELGISQVSLLADDLLGSIPVPGIAGATITSPTFQPVGGYLLLGGDIAFE
ncbi:MAG TPA: Ig-like domain-containing protein [Kofleriaceae bacterium]|nr:Ig-like domain-containing protein [Kofleriaceae bacterium]